MQGRLDGRVAIVTGGSEGIAAAIAERVSAIRARGGSASFATLDVPDHDRLAAFIQSTAAARGRLDALINNAPSANYGAIADMSLEACRRSAGPSSTSPRSWGCSPRRGSLATARQRPH
jgi:3-oxoacyl-[acyl-carrier protein] reductase